MDYEMEVLNLEPVPTTPANVLVPTSSVNDFIRLLQISQS